METWHETVRKALKAQEVRLVTYVPDKVLAPLIKAVHADEYFTVLSPAREEEAVGIVTRRPARPSATRRASATGSCAAWV